MVENLNTLKLKDVVYWKPTLRSLCYTWPLFVSEIFAFDAFMYFQSII